MVDNGRIEEEYEEYEEIEKSEEEKIEEEIILTGITSENLVEILGRIDEFLGDKEYFNTRNVYSDNKGLCEFLKSPGSSLREHVVKKGNALASFKSFHEIKPHSIKIVKYSERNRIVLVDLLGEHYFIDVGNGIYFDDIKNVLIIEKPPKESFHKSYFQTWDFQE
jgi:hypothetical protein